MGLGSYLETMLSELHSDTWFTTPGLQGVTATTIGTRPGSCFADVFFNYLFAEVLKEVKDELIEYGMLTEVHWGGVRSLYMDGNQDEESEILAETVWADDLALFFQHPDPEQLVANLRAGSTTMLNAYMRYGLEPNFTKGKTEAIVALRGKGSVKARRRWFTEHNGRLDLPDCAAPETYIRMIARYRHLGGQVDAQVGRPLLCSPESHPRESGRTARPTAIHPTPHQCQPKSPSLGDLLLELWNRVVKVPLFVASDVAILTLALGELPYGLVPKLSCTFHCNVGDEGVAYTPNTPCCMQHSACLLHRASPC